MCVMIGSTKQRILYKLPLLLITTSVSTSFQRVVHVISSLRILINGCRLCEAFFSLANISAIL